MLLQKLLTDFVGEYANFLEHLVELNHEKKYEELNRYVHTVKGLSAVIGAKDLSYSCQVLEELVKSSEYDQKFEKCLSKLGKNFSAVMEDLANNGFEPHA